MPSCVQNLLVEVQAIHGYFILFPLPPGTDLKYNKIKPQS
jgi:hypothetical protein